MIYFEGEERPWGVFFVPDDEFTFKKKQIEVDPRGRLCCQYHHMRTKARTILEGTEVIKLDRQDN